MANFSTADVKRLRELTGAGMMDCKRALDESDGDFDKAVELLRIKGAKDIGKRAERTTAEGLVAAAGGALIELDSETDFVAKNAEFQQLAENVVNAAAQLEAGSGVEAVLAAPLGAGTVADAINAASVKLGEKLELRRVVKYDGPTTVYLHKRSADLPPSIGVLVQYTGETDDGRRGGSRGCDADRLAQGPATSPGTRSRPTWSSPRSASPRRPRARRASRKPRSPASSRAGSTGSSRRPC